MIAALLALLPSTLAQPGGDVPVTGSWQRVTEHAAFSPRDTAEGVVFLSKLWISNAYSHGNVLTRDLWFSEDGAEWVCVSEDTPYDDYAEMIVYGGRLWAVKGSVWSSEDGLEWTRVLEETPFGARGYGELVVFDGKMWQLGSGKDVWCSTDGIEWTCVCEDAPYGDRYGTAVEVFDGKLWLMAGATREANDPPEGGYPDLTTHNDVWRSEDGVTWECVLEEAPWPPRMWVVPAVYRDRLWIVGGYNNRDSENFGDVWTTEDGERWEEFAPEGHRFAPRHEVTCYTWRDNLWVVAGNTWPVVNDVWRLTLPE